MTYRIIKSIFLIRRLLTARARRKETPAAASPSLRGRCGTAEAVQGRGGVAGQRPALPGEVRLVGIAGPGGGGRQVGQGGRRVEQPDEALEAEHPLERLGPVPRGGLAPAAQR